MQSRYSRPYQNSLEARVPLIFYLGSGWDDGICHYELDQFNEDFFVNEGKYVLNKLRKFQREQITDGMADQITVHGVHCIMNIKPCAQAPIQDTMALSFFFLLFSNINLR
jgi:hypothetical protein